MLFQDGQLLSVSELSQPSRNISVRSTLHSFLEFPEERTNATQHLLWGNIWRSWVVPMNTPAFIPVVEKHRSLTCCDDSLDILSHFVNVPQ